MQSYWGNIQPPAGTPIEQDHPLANGLLCAMLPSGEGYMVDSVRAGRISTLAGNRTYGPRGIALGNWSLLGPQDDLFFGAAQNWLAGGLVAVTPTSATADTAAILQTLTYTNESTNAGWDVGIASPDQSGTSGYYFRCYNNSATSLSVAHAGTPTAGDHLILGGVNVYKGSDVIWVDGYSLGSTATRSPQAQTSALANNTTGGKAGRTPAYAIYVWATAAAPGFGPTTGASGFQQELLAEPYCLWAPPTPVRVATFLMAGPRVYVSSASDTGTFTGIADGHVARPVSASGMGVFTGTASAVASRPKSASDTGTFSESPIGHRAGIIFAGDTGTFADLAAGHKTTSSSASGAGTFTDVAVAHGVYPASASDTGVFSERVRGHTPGHGFARDTGTFRDAASARNSTRKAGASSQAAFSDDAEAVKVASAAASDLAIFADLAKAFRAYRVSAHDTGTFSDLAKSNGFFRVSARDTGIFSDLARAFKVPLGASDLGIFSDRADAWVTISPTGPRTPIYDPIDGSLPLSYAESADGLVLMANGLDPMICWDGTSGKAWAAGVPPPTEVVWIDPPAGGLLTGVRYAFTRWIDERGNPSIFSPISDPVDLGHDGVIQFVSPHDGGAEVASRGHGLASGDVVVVQGVDDGESRGVESVNGTWTVSVLDEDSFVLAGAAVPTGCTYHEGGSWTKGSTSVEYSHVEAPADPKITRRQILRNLEGNTRVFYVDIDTADLVGTSFSSTRTDEDLATQTAVPLQLDDKEPYSQRYYRPPSHKKAVAAYAGRIWAAADLIYRTGNAAVSYGSPVVQGIGTAWTESMAGRLFYAAGAAAPQPIASVLRRQQLLVLETPFRGQSNPFTFYTVRPAPIERRLVYFCEPNLPEAWAPWNAFAVPESSDEIVGLFVLNSFLYIAKERHVYKFTFREDPAMDGYVWPVAARGCVNNRCYAQVDDIYYLLDEMGVYAFDGEDTKPVSMPMASLFKSDGASPYRIDWSTDRTLWSCVQDPVRETLRWFVDLVGKPPLSFAICWDYRGNQWWLEQYAEAVTASALGVVNGSRQSMAGTTGRRVFCLGHGTLDGVSEDTPGTLRGQATAGGSLALTDSAASFPPGLAGVPVAIVAGRGAGQVAIISASTDTTLTPVDPWSPEIPDATSVYQIGGVPWIWKSGWRRMAEDEAQNPRDLEIAFGPTRRASTVNASLFYDHSDSPATWSYDYSSDGITVAAGSPHLTVDMSVARGYAIQRLSGHRDPYAFGNRYVSAQLHGVQGVDAHKVYQMVINGAQ